MILDIPQIYRKQPVRELAETQKAFYGEQKYRTTLNVVKHQLRLVMWYDQVPPFELYRKTMEHMHGRHSKMGDIEYRTDIIFVTIATWELMHEADN